MSESNIVEILDAQGNPVKYGETGDMASLSNETNKDGRGLHVIEQIHGRSTDFLVHQDGSIVHALAAIYILWETEGVEQFKIIQHDINQFEILTIKNALWRDNAMQNIEQKFKERFGNAANIDIRLLEMIEPEASGKTKQVVAKINPIS